MAAYAAVLLFSAAGFVAPNHPTARAHTRASVRHSCVPTMSDHDYTLTDVGLEIHSGAAQILDVRERDEWEGGHLHDAIFAPLSMLQQGELPAGVDLSKRIYTHCAKGFRAAKAEALLKEMGAADVTGLREGYDVLVHEGVDRSYTGGGF